jgi:hypothetical protein
MNKLNRLQWFALSSNYGKSYGDILKGYTWITYPKLLDIGNGSVRTMIRDTIREKDPTIDYLSNPDEQYSGTKANNKYHSLVQKYFGDKYDGTIIDGTYLHGNQYDDEGNINKSGYSAENLEGPSEIVLWHNYSQLLKEITKTIPKKSKSNKSKSKKSKSKKSKSKKSKSNKSKSTKSKSNKSKSNKSKSNK